jgi:hypothetical protein
MSGDAYCQYTQSQQQADLSNQKAQALTSLQAQLKTYQDQYKTAYNHIVQLRHHIDVQCLNIDMNFHQGQGQVQQQQDLADCSALSQQVERESQLLAPIQQQEADIQQRINYINSLPIQ